MEVACFEKQFSKATQIIFATEPRRAKTQITMPVQGMIFVKGVPNPNIL